MTWPGLTKDVERVYSTCPVYHLTKMNKNERKKYRLLPPKALESDPLKTHSLLALTMIDPDT